VTETQRKILDRVEMARRELDGAETLADTAERRRTWAADLRAQADRIERDGVVVAGRPPEHKWGKL
jgi:hypothetical protein